MLCSTSWSEKFSQAAANLVNLCVYACARRDAGWQRCCHFPKSTTPRWRVCSVTRTERRAASWSPWQPSSSFWAGTLRELWTRSEVRKKKVKLQVPNLWTFLFIQRTAGSWARACGRASPQMWRAALAWCCGWPRGRLTGERWRSSVTCLGWRNQTVREANPPVRRAARTLAEIFCFV